MAYRKRLKIARGLHLSFSGSGIGIGYRLFPGLSLSANASGIYCNTSVPGTGFYSRNKISTWGNSNVDNDESSSNETEFIIKLNVDDDNNVTYNIVYAEDQRPVDDELFAYLKRQDSFKAALREVYEKTIQDYIDETEERTDIYKLTPKIVSEEDIERAIDDIELKQYKPEYFLVTEPSIASVREILLKEASNKIKTLFFWKLKGLKEEYVDKNLNSRYEELHSKWLTEKEEHIAQENSKKEVENARLLKEYESEVASLKSVIEGKEEYVNERIESLLNSLEMPVDFSVQYQYDEENSTLKIGLELPRIELFPKQKGSILSNGMLSVKYKTKQELNHQYATCVTGMSFFFAGMLFNISTHIKSIEVDGFSMAIDGATGNEVEKVLYNVTYDRTQFSQLNIPYIDPILSLQSFPSKINILKTEELRPIN